MKRGLFRACYCHVEQNTVNERDIGAVSRDSQDQLLFL